MGICSYFCGTEKDTPKVNLKNVPDIDFFSPLPGETIWTTHQEVLSRATGGTGVVIGNRINPDHQNGMKIVVGPGQIKIAGKVVTVSSETVEIESADPKLDRIDVIYRDKDGNAMVVQGQSAYHSKIGVKNLVVQKNEKNWHDYDHPKPPTEIPNGCILGAVYVAAGVSDLKQDDIWMFAGRVQDFVQAPAVDIVKTIAEPGSDCNVPSEKAIKSELNKVQLSLGQKIDTSSIVTTISSPGSDSKVPTEKAVRSSLNWLRIGSIQVVLDGGNAPILPGHNVDVIVDYPCSILGWKMVAEPVLNKSSGSILVDLWKCMQINFPPEARDSIVRGSNKPEISRSTHAIGTTEGWDTTLEEGHILRLNVDGCTDMQRVAFSLKVAKKV